MKPLYAWLALAAALLAAPVVAAPFEIAVNPSRFQMVFGAQNLIEFAHDVHRQANRARLIHDRLFDRLTDPPGRIR